MLSSEALVRGHRRRASALDVTDFEAAFDDLVNPRQRPWWVDCVVDCGLFFGGGFVGAGTNIVTGGGSYATGGLVIGAGVFVGGFSIAVKYLKLH